MHEYGLMEDILARAHDQVRRGERVQEVELRLGEFAGADADSLAAAFEALSKGTPFDSARLRVVTVPGRLACGACEFQGSAEDAGLDDIRTPPWICPACGYLLAASEGGNLELGGFVLRTAQPR